MQYNNMEYLVLLYPLQVLDHCCKSLILSDQGYSSFYVVIHMLLMVVDTTDEAFLHCTVHLINNIQQHYY